MNREYFLGNNNCLVRCYKLDYDASFNRFRNFNPLWVVINICWGSTNFKKPLSTTSARICLSTIGEIDKLLFNFVFVIPVLHNSSIWAIISSLLLIDTLSLSFHYKMNFWALRISGDNFERTMHHHSHDSYFPVAHMVVIESLALEPSISFISNLSSISIIQSTYYY